MCKSRLEKLKSGVEAKPHGDLEKEAVYLCDTLKPLMNSLRQASNQEPFAACPFFPQAWLSTADC